MKIVDSFIFNNELDLLNYRLNLLYPYVDHFIICESIYTHSGKSKPLYFKDNIDKFDKFMDKILHLYIYEYPYIEPNIDYAKNHQWANESFHRNSLCIGYKNLNLDKEDIVIVSDLDEIINPEILKKIRDNELIINDTYYLEMDMYYYNLYNRFYDFWYKAYITNINSINENNDLTAIRLNYPSKIIPIGGWHLSYFGDLTFIQKKLQDFTHQEFNNEYYKNESYLKKCILDNKSFISNEELEFIPLEKNERLPPDYQEFLSKYA
jgi:beta-1,4-mannosyl-glycoprotein beta-1,4-N-acetylglucosaminyltransferase